MMHYCDEIEAERMVVQRSDEILPAPLSNHFVHMEKVQICGFSFEQRCSANADDVDQHLWMGLDIQVTSWRVPVDGFLSS